MTTPKTVTPDTASAPARRTLFVPTGADPSYAIKALRLSLGDGWLAFDIETNALGFGDSREEVRSIQLGTKTVAVLLDPSDPVHRVAARELLNDPAIKKTAHNALFDTLRLVKLEIFDSVDEAWERTTDTFLEISLLVPPDGSHSDHRDLKSATAAWCGQDAGSKDAKEDLKKFQKSKGWYGVGTAGWNAYRKVAVAADGSVSGDPLVDNTWALVPRDQPDYVAYCAGDVYDSAHLVEALDPIARGLWPDRVEAEHRAARQVAGMVYAGVGLDREKAVQLWVAAHTRRDVAAVTLAALGVADPSDTEVVADLIRQEARTDLPEDAARETITVPKKLRKGDAAKDGEDGKTVRARMLSEMDKRSLKTYAAQGSQIAPHLRVWRQAEKEISTYLNFYLRTPATRIHADINTIEARTGRMASRNPNLQNVPNELKPCFVAASGHVFISADFKSIEMRVAAAITGDPELLRMYTEPLPENATERQVRERDPYWLIAWAVWGESASREDRGLAKIICLGSMYGGGAETLAGQVDIPVGLAEKILATYNARFPQLREWAKKNLEPRVKAGLPFWTTPTGRFQSLDPMFGYKALNLLIQGTARDLLLDAMFRLEDAGLGQYMRLPIHDEIVFEVPAEQADALTVRILAAMGSTWRGVPIVAEAVVLGQHWTAK
jgi:DNA polymerase-1